MRTVGVRPAPWYLRRRTVRQTHDRPGLVDPQHIELLAFEWMVVADDGDVKREIGKVVLSL
jgi:hypothetical protein